MRSSVPLHFSGPPSICAYVPLACPIQALLSRTLLRTRYRRNSHDLEALARLRLNRPQPHLSHNVTGGLNSLITKSLKSY